MEAVRIGGESQGVAQLLAVGISVREERLGAACTTELFATDYAYELVTTGVPFRDAYQQVADNPTAQAPGDLVARLRARTSEGAPGNLGLERVAARVDAERAAWQERQQRVTAAIAAL